MDENQPDPPAESAAAPPAEPEIAAAAPTEAAADAAPETLAGGPAPTPAKPAKVKKEKKEESWWDTLRFLLWLFLAAIVLRTFLFAPFSIPSASMMPNLLVGDYLFVSKWSYGYSRYSFPFHPINFDGRLLGGVPERGDVVVFRHPGGDDWVKRVIGLPGDTIEVRNGVVILNGQPIPRAQMEPFDLPVSPNSPADQQGRACAPDREGFVPGTYAVRIITDGSGRQHCLYPRYRETLPNGRSYEVLDQGLTAPNVQADGSAMSADNPGRAFTVPPGHLFVMGDNRDDSLDSRFEVRQGGVGLLPIDNVLGRATIGFWSTDGSAQWLLPWTWFTAARWSRIGHTY
jgi:signal peptidase I